MDPTDVVLVPHDLKGPILEHLRIGRGISAATIYNDLHGFIRYQNTHQSAYAEFYAGLTHERKGDNETALHHYSSSIALNPRMAVTYSNRGIVYTREGEYDLAVRDLDRAIELAPHFANAYCGRGIAHLSRGDLENAIQDLDRTIELDPATAYSNRGVAHMDQGELERFKTLTGRSSWSRTRQMRIPIVAPSIGNGGKWNLRSWITTGR